MNDPRNNYVDYTRTFWWQKYEPIRLRALNVSQKESNKQVLELEEQIGKFLNFWGELSGSKGQISEGIVWKIEFFKFIKGIKRFNAVRQADK